MTTFKILATRECQHCQVLNNTELQQYIGKSYNYEFDNGVGITKDGSSCHMRGALSAFLPFGCIEHADLESLELEGKRMLQWSESIGLLEPGTKLWIRIQETAPNYVAAVITNGVPLERARLGFLFLFLGWSTDDILDNSYYQERNEPYPYDAVLEDINIILRFLNEDTDAETLSQVPEAGRVLPKLRAFAEAMLELRKLCLATNIDTTTFFKSLSNNQRFCALESDEFYQIHEEIEYLYTKIKCQGLVTTMEAIFLVLGLSPSKELRADPMFLTFCYLIGQQIGLVNDLLSLKKELELGENKNIIILRNNLSRSCFKVQQTLQEIFDGTVAETNRLTGRILQLKGKLLNHFPGNETLSKCIEAGLNYGNASLNVYVDSERYINNPTYLAFNT